MCPWSAMYNVIVDDGHYEWSQFSASIRSFTLISTRHHFVSDSLESHAASSRSQYDWRSLRKHARSTSHDIKVTTKRWFLISFHISSSLIGPYFITVPCRQILFNSPFILRSYWISESTTSIPTSFRRIFWLPRHCRTSPLRIAPLCCDDYSAVGVEHVTERLPLKQDFTPTDT